MSLGGPEILVILVMALLVLGPDKLPGALKTAGKAFGEFKKYQNMAKDEIDKAMSMANEEPKKEVTKNPDKQEISDSIEDFEDKKSDLKDRSPIKPDDDSKKSSQDKVKPIIDDETEPS